MLSGETVIEDGGAVGSGDLSVAGNGVLNEEGWSPVGCEVELACLRSGNGG